MALSMSKTGRNLGVLLDLVLTYRHDTHHVPALLTSAKPVHPPDFCGRPIAPPHPTATTCQYLQRAACPRRSPARRWCANKQTQRARYSKLTNCAACNPTTCRAGSTYVFFVLVARRNRQAGSPAAVPRPRPRFESPPHTQTHTHTRARAPKALKKEADAGKQPSQNPAPAVPHTHTHGLHTHKTHAPAATRQDLGALGPRTHAPLVDRQVRHACFFCFEKRVSGVPFEGRQTPATSGRTRSRRHAAQRARASSVGAGECAASPAESPAVA